MKEVVGIVPSDSESEGSILEEAAESAEEHGGNYDAYRYLEIRFPFLQLTNIRIIYVREKPNNLIYIDKYSLHEKNR